MNNNLYRLVEIVRGADVADELFETLAIAVPLREESTPGVSRAVLAQALTMILFGDLLERVPHAALYVEEARETGRPIVFDHGALRTVDGFCGALPPGEASITRVLRPLGYLCRDIYPLDRLKMTGRAWCHEDFPEDVAQFFVSELHLDRFTPEFAEVAQRALSTSRDPLSPLHVGLLEALSRDRILSFESAARLLPALVACFARQHDVFALADYERLLEESAEMAWISTEGHAFNHATDRVTNVEQLADDLRKLGRPVKEKVEISASGRVRQTALRAQLVRRHFTTAEGVIARDVPGSFYEFISRDLQSEGAENGKLDLRFDSGNATGIFGMTRA